MAYLFPYAGQEKTRNDQHPYYKELRRQQRANRKKQPTHAPRKIEAPEPEIPLTQEQVKFTGLGDVPPSLRNLMVEICREHNVTPEDMRGLDSRKHVVQARRVYCIRAKDETDASYCKIARSIGRDHTTVIYFVKQGHSGCSMTPVKQTTTPPLGTRRNALVTAPTELERVYMRHVEAGLTPKEIEVAMGKSASCVRHYKNRLKKKARLAAELAKK